MEDILQEINLAQKSKQATFSKLAFGSSLFTFTSLMGLFLNIFLIMHARGGNPNIMKISGGMVLLGTILGLTFSIIALIRKEKLKYLKVVGAVLNIGLFIVVFGIMLYSLFET